MSLRIVQLDDDPESPFPSIAHALAEPDGLLAFGGDLSPIRLLNAYRHGIFPWFSEDEPPLWWSPSQRAVFRTERIRLSSRRRRALRTSTLVVRADTCFRTVIEACAHLPRPSQGGGTWITGAIVEAYVQLHRLGHAHSIEVFDGNALVGGLYGLAIGRMFCGESMFSAQSGASTIALAALAQRLHAWGWPLIDAQVPNDHTRMLGVETWPRTAYLQALESLLGSEGLAGNWAQCFGEIPAASLATPSAA
ncbi:leucyl/phenylalanyl-tRNA--protein transferase [Thermomonas carbonis]|uniref:Leucyl/phenylalanyl-tRNA--protein transferase n=1 Tax=Thermomonas carbonis TaxID=1463158 RepID=A0A7G9SP14_9GAMM|nr:leucyl/phenylalanyl-tRNA--protein transferase [Thermomonas carbonis]QNN69589.1 leucyl/phenylalanyl-tRNA--protein transferase [Thermomonas carbonis]GHB94102.1 leucyl/phenylalanyl-tRNA--protein transferase [Thermomonas carbonis]